MCRKPKSEKRAPLLVATEFTTSWSPRVTSTSVTVSSSDPRFEIASRCVWALVQTLATRAYGSSRVGLLQDRAGDIDRIVEGELVDDIDRGLVETGQPPRQLGAGGHFNLVREPSDDLAEGPDFVIAVTARDHQIGGMPQRPGAALGGTPRYRVVEIP